MTPFRRHYLLWATGIAAVAMGCQGPTGDASKLPAPAPCKPKADTPAKPVVAKPAKPVVAKPAKPVVAKPAKPVVAKPAQTALFDGSVHGFQIRYPLRWDIQSNTGRRFIVAFMTQTAKMSGFRDNINVVSAPRARVTLKQWLKIEDYALRHSKTQQQFKVLNSKPGTVGGLPGNIREASSLINAKPVRFKQHTVYTKTRVIQVTYSAAEERYKSGLPRYHAIVATLRLQ